MMYRRFPIEQITRKTVKSDIHNYTALYDISCDPNSNKYFISLFYMLNDSIDVQLSVTKTIDTNYIKQIYCSNLDVFVILTVDGMLRQLKQEFWDKYSIAIATDNDTFKELIRELQNVLVSMFENY